MNWRFAFHILIAACVCNLMAARALADNYQVETWTTERGLSDSSVTAIAQTPDGYLWIGTYNGLARFDGLNFVVFDPENTPALAHPRVRQLFLDRQGALWINTFDGSLTRMKDGKFFREWTSKFQNDRDNTLVYSRSNAIAIVLDRGDIFKKDLAAPAGEGWTQLAMPNRNLLTTSSPDGECLAWFDGQYERTGQQENAGVKRMWRLVDDHFQPMPEIEQLNGRRIRSVTALKNGRYWLGTDTSLYFWDGEKFLESTPTNGPAQMDFSFLCPVADGGVWAVADGNFGKLGRGGWATLVPGLENNFRILGSRFQMDADNENGVWIHGREHGLIHVAADGSLWRLNAEVNGLNDRVTCVFTDREGNQWAGFELAGLARIHAARLQHPALAVEDAVRSMLSACVDSTGDVWLGTVGGGLIRYNKSGETNFVFTGDAPRGSVVSCCPDRQGRIWASAGGENLYRGQNGVFSPVTPPIHNVKAILAGTASGKIWVGTRNGLFMSKDGDAPFFPVQEIGSKTVRALAEDSHGDLWCGDDDGMLYRLADETVEAFHPEDTSHSYAIWSLLPEADGTIWIGTFRDGLLRFKDGKFTRFTQIQGLPDNVVSQVLSDHAGNLWLGTPHGIFRVTRQSLEEVADGKRAEVDGIVFGRADGLPSLQCAGGYNPSAWRAEDGTLWLTTLKGVVSVQPQNIKINSQVPNILIEEVLSAGKQTWPSSEKGTQKLIIAPGQGQTEFHFTGLSFSAPERVKYRYQLVGEDADWVEAGSRRFAHYASLRPGDYRFKVTACNADGVWNPKPTEFAFAVLPHFYETLWFRLLAGAILLAVAGLTVRFIVVRRLRFKMQELERRHAIERERIRIAKDIHDDLGANLNLIAVLGDLAKKDRTDERIDKLSSTARQTVKSLDEIVWAVNPRNDTVVNMVDYTGEFAIGYLRSAEIRCLHDFPEFIPECEVAANVRHNFFLVTKEALQNIIKHSRATEVWLRVNVTPGKLTVVIEDNGCGFENTTEDPWADGLHNIRQRLADIRGQCQIRSQLGKGTSITIELPLPALK